MTTTNGSNGPAAAPTGGAPAASSSGPAVSSETKAPAPGSTGSRAALTPGPAPNGGGEAAAPAPEKKGPRLSQGARALQRAQARQAAGAAAGSPTSPKTSEPVPGASPGAEATDGGKPPAGAAAPAAPAAGTSPSPDSPAADAGALLPPASTVEAPADWAADRRERFAAIKDPAGQSLVLDMYQDMHAGFTTAMTHLAQERERHQDLFTLDQQFQSDPKAVLTELAKRAKMEVWFEPPAPAGEVPDFKDPAEMARWVAEQATRQARLLVEAERTKEREAQAGREAEAQRAKAREALTAELAEAHKAHPDFATHRPKVLEKLKAAPGLSVAEAYQLVTYPALAKRLAAGEAAVRELAAAKAEDAKRRAAVTQPPAAAATATATGTERPMSAAERAYRKVAAKKAAAGNPAAH